MVLHYLVVTATVIGFFVMLGWALTIVWFVSKIVGEFRFNRLLKKRAEREYDHESTDWSDNFDTTEIPIGFRFYEEDDYATEETAAVFDIQERYSQ